MMMLSFTGRLTREEQLYLYLGPYIRRSAIVYLKYLGVTFVLVLAIYFVRFGPTERAFVNAIMLLGIMAALLAALTLFRVMKMIRAMKDQEQDALLTLTAETVAVEMGGVRQSIPVNLVSIRNDRRGVIARYKNDVLFFLPERVISREDRIKLRDMFGLPIPSTGQEKAG